MPVPEALTDVFTERVEKLRGQIQNLAKEHVPLREAALEAGELLEELSQKRDELMILNRRLAMVSAESSELVVEVEEKNSALVKANHELSRANARAAELIGEIEDKNDQIDTLNHVLSSANASAAELVAELELSKEELEKTNRKLEEANAEKSHLLGMFAHDLQSGVAGIGSLADLLSDLLSEESREVLSFAGLIHEESHRLIELLASILDVSSLEQGKLELDLIKFNINMFVQDAVDYYQAFACAKSQELELILDDAIPKGKADPIRIRQVCDNLISNAIKFSPKGSCIKVKTEFKNDRLWFIVKDEGPGLTSEDQRKLFHTFKPLTAKPTGGETSQGLGLTIAHKVIRFHHGSIWGENRKSGKGAQFGFSIPLDPGMISVSSPGRITSPDTYEILLFDPIRVNLMLANRVVHQLGHHLHACVSRDIFLQILERHCIDLILMDCDMDSEGSFNLAKAIAAGELAQDKRHIPILGLSENPDILLKNACLEAGMRTCLPKPLTRESLSHLIRRWLKE